MTCSSDVRESLYPYINAFVDNELSYSDRSAIKKHLEVCAHCANERFQIEQMKSRLHNELAFPAPYRLRESIKNSIAKTVDKDVNLANVEKNRFSWRWTYYIIPPVVTAVAVLLIVLAILPQYEKQRIVVQDGTVEQEIISAHVRSLMEDNLVHIESNPDLVKPWFDSRLDFVAQPKDLSEEGFNLVGGRLDYLNRHSAASIVYESADRHIINLFIFPSNEPPQSFENMRNRGYNIVKWTSNGLVYYAISDLSMQELNKFAHTFSNKEAEKKDKAPES